MGEATHEPGAGEDLSEIRVADARFNPVDIGIEAEVSTTSSSWSDWDLDGDPDLLLLDKEKATWYVNEGGTFDAEDDDGVIGKTGGVTGRR